MAAGQAPADGCQGGRTQSQIGVGSLVGGGGGSAEKPVGLVWFAAAQRGADPAASERRFGGIGRGAVRLATVATALDLLDRLIDEPAQAVR